VHPITALQTAYSLWTRNPEIAALDACRQIGAAFVAFSPLARGFLTGALRDVEALVHSDLRRSMPRFQPAAYAINLKLLHGLSDIARELGCTLAQLSLAWVLSRGEHIVALPGTRRIEHLEDDLGGASVALDGDVMRRLDALINQRTVVGERYDATAQASVDTEEFASTS